MLFNEQERANMSCRMATYVVRHGVDEILALIDLKSAQGRDLEAQEDCPFGVLYDSDVPSPLGNQSSTRDCQHTAHEDLSTVLTDTYELDVFDFAEELPQASMVGDVDTVQARDVIVGFDGQQTFNIEDSGEFDMLLQPDLAMMSAEFPRFSDATSISLNFDQEPAPPSTFFLLGHYKEHVGKLFSPLRVRKSPWEVLHYQGAVTTHTELCLSTKPSNAKLALFYAALSVSSYHFDTETLSMNTTGSTSFWWSLGGWFQKQAQLQLQKSCESELDGAAKAKYKDLLMAILAMATISVVNGHQDEARSFLLNAELFICHRGVPKATKSRKAKLLHHIYLFLRVIEESTHVYPIDLPPPASPIHDDTLQFPSLRTHSLFLGKDLDKLCGGSFEAGLVTDPSTELVGPRDSTIFGHICGFPEQLLAFISQVTALANELSHHNAENQHSPPDDLQLKSKTLEHKICTWRYTDSITYGKDDMDGNLSHANRTIITPLVLASHGAIIIFYYRRIGHIHPLLLQPLVEKVIDHLEKHENEKVTMSVSNTGIVWPGFIAAVEAHDDHLQQRLYSWLRKCATRTGMRNFDVAADFVLELWEYRREMGDATISWIQLVRDRNRPLVLT